MEPHETVLEETSDCSDDHKRRVFNEHRALKEDIYTRFGEIMSEAVGEDISPYAEHTHKGLNLRVVCDQDKTVEQVKAMATHWDLTCIEESKTNPNPRSPTWLRFRFVSQNS